MADPAYKLTTEDRQGYLYAKMSGEKDSLESTMAAVTELAGICLARKVNRLLVEHDMPGKLSTLDVYKMASRLPELFDGIDVAFVIHRSEIPDNPKFLENVARNRGATGRLFSSVEDAEAWLLAH
ncbi:MAG TPA: hypothetical protein VNM14_02820 [Planctomycetota bacterium]|jgi:hypothetical protein|nr:hypothetical protein [Planctomycetota bacterium]